MGDIDTNLFELKEAIKGLSKIVLSGYEWRLTMIILDETLCQGKETAPISLEDFYQRTKIRKSHVSRALSTLQERNVVRKRVISGDMTWWINPKTETWRSYIDFKIPNSVPKRVEIAWEKWIDRYPDPMSKMFLEDSKAMYVSLVMENGNLIEKLEDCLTGYIKLSVHRARKANREPDELMVMYPTSFLRNKTYENFERYKFIKKEENL